MVVLSLQGFVRCVEDADPTRTQGYKSTGAEISDISCVAKSAVGFLAVSWGESVLRHMGRAVRIPALVRSGGRGAFLVLF